jgi:hypothetical protein
MSASRADWCRLADQFEHFYDRYPLSTGQYPIGLTHNHPLEPGDDPRSRRRLVEGPSESARKEFDSLLVAFGELLGPGDDRQRWLRACDVAVAEATSDERDVQRSNDTGEPQDDIILIWDLRRVMARLCRQRDNTAARPDSEPVADTTAPVTSAPVPSGPLNPSTRDESRLSGDEAGRESASLPAPSSRIAHDEDARSDQAAGVVRAADLTTRQERRAAIHEWCKRWSTDAGVVLEFDDFCHAVEYHRRTIERWIETGTSEIADQKIRQILDLPFALVKNKVMNHRH